jgi:hypothetical protein
LAGLLVRGQIAYAVPPLIMTLGSRSLGPIACIVIVAALFLLVGYGDRDYRGWTDVRDPVRRNRFVGGQHRQCNGHRGGYLTFQDASRSRESIFVAAPPKAAFVRSQNDNPLRSNDANPYRQAK